MVTSGSSWTSGEEGTTAKYTVTLKLDCRVDVEVEADSFAEAFEKAKSKTYDWNKVEAVGRKPVNATDGKGTMEDHEE